MIATGTMLGRLQSMIMDESTETKAELLEHLNSSYMELAAEHPWEDLRTEVTISTSLIPADCERWIYAQDDTDELYFKIGFPQRYFSEKLYNYFTNLHTTTPLLTGTDLVTTANSVTVTSATGGLTAAMVGEYIRINQNRGIYKIATRVDTNTITLTNVFRGASSTTNYFEVRPNGTKQIAMTDETGAAITPTSFTLWYLRKPLPLYNDYDPILLPGECDALRIKVLQLMMVSDKYDNDALKQVGNYEQALAKMRSLNPLPERFMVPRNKFGQRLSFGRYRSNVAYGIHSDRLY